MAQGQDKGLLSVCGLWLSESREGRKYFSGRLGNLKVFVFRNNKKTKDDQPDYYLSVGEWKRAEGEGAKKTGDDVPF